MTCGDFIPDLSQDCYKPKSTEEMVLEHVRKTLIKAAKENPDAQVAFYQMGWRHTNDSHSFVVTILGFDLTGIPVKVDSGPIYTTNLSEVRQ